jgi:hypothetical protein
MPREYRTVERFSDNADGWCPHSVTIVELRLESREAGEVKWQLEDIIAPFPCKRGRIFRRVVTALKRVGDTFVPKG